MWFYFWRWNLRIKKVNRAVGEFKVTNFVLSFIDSISVAWWGYLIGRAIKNNSGLNSDTIEKILYTYTDLNPEWFISESGEMLKTNNQNINNNGSGNNVNSNINGNISGNVTISHSEFSNMIEIQKGYQEIQKELTERLKTSQEQLSDSMRQVTILLEILKR